MTTGLSQDHLSLSACGTSACFKYSIFSNIHLNASYACKRQCMWPPHQPLHAMNILHPFVKALEPWGNLIIDVKISSIKWMQRDGCSAVVAHARCWQVPLGQLVLNTCCSNSGNQ
jgi:hypothetical protein